MKRDQYIEGHRAGMDAEITNLPSAAIMEQQDHDFAHGYYDAIAKRLLFDKGPAVGPKEAAALAYEYSSVIPFETAAASFSHDKDQLNIFTDEYDAIGFKHSGEEK